MDCINDDQVLLSLSSLERFRVELIVILDLWKGEEVFVEEE